MTLPASVDITNNGAVVLIFDPSALLLNPDPGSTTLDVSTSVETAAVTSNAYTIKNVATRTNVKIVQSIGVRS